MKDDSVCQPSLTALFQGFGDISQIHDKDSSSAPGRTFCYRFKKHNYEKQQKERTACLMHIARGYGFIMNPVTGGITAAVLSNSLHRVGQDLHASVSCGQLKQWNARTWLRSPCRGRAHHSSCHVATYGCKSYFSHQACF